MTSREIRLRIGWTFVGALSVAVAREMWTANAMAKVASSAGQGSQAAASPRPVRNNVPVPGRELLVLRHHQLRKGGHEEFYRLSSENVWPFFERNGARIVGQWKIAESEQGLAADADEVYRLVRYASYPHWEATRSVRSSGAAAVGGGGADVALGGNGPAWERSMVGYSTRGGLETGSKGAYFLEGRSAPGGPYFMPGLDESYDLLQSDRRADLTDAHIPVRLNVAQPGVEIVEVRYQRIRKGSYERFAEATHAAVWPWEEKLGARPLGQWRVVYPPAPHRTSENPGYDEIVTMTRYASREHRAAMRQGAAVFMGGNGPDYHAWQSALRMQQDLTLSSSVEVAQGVMYQSPPKFLPGLAERYQLKKP